MTDTATKKNNNMQGMDHSKMPGMKQPVKTPPAKTPAKKAPAKKAPAKTPAPMQGMDHSKMNMGTNKTPAAKTPAKKTTPTKKPTPKKPAPKKKDPMEGMDHSKMKMGYIPPKKPVFNTGLNTSLYGASTFSTTLAFSSGADTVPDKKASSATQGHDMHNMGNMNMDTVPKKNQQNMNMQGHNMGNMKMDTVPKKNQPPNMQNMNMANMGGMEGGKEKSSLNLRDTSRSYMLQTMMPKMPLTGYDFPPENGNDVVLSYDMLQSDTATALPSNRPWREIKFTLSGNMQRYVWSINGKTLSQQDEKVLIRKGENVRIVFTNATMMEHPMHLHGHFFRVINNRGQYAPMKHTFNINPMGTQVIEFAATEEKDWFLHCHILYHMSAGMATILSYEGTTSVVQQAHPQEFKKFKKEHGSGVFPWGDASVHSQGTFGNLFISGLRWQFNPDWRWNYRKTYDIEARFQYFLDKRQFFSVFAGTEFSASNVKHGKEVPSLDKERLATLGLIYTLPFLVDAEGRIDHTGKFRFQLRREDIALTTRTRADFYWNTENEYGITARYIVAKHFAVSGNYDHQYGWGAGISIVY